MNIATKAMLLFLTGIAIGIAGLVQMYAALTTEQPLMSVVGFICVALALWCCSKNWQVWKQWS